MLQDGATDATHAGARSAPRWRRAPARDQPASRRHAFARQQGRPRRISRARGSPPGLASGSATTWASTTLRRDRPMVSRASTTTKGAGHPHRTGRLPWPPPARRTIRKIERLAMPIWRSGLIAWPAWPGRAQGSSRCRTMPMKTARRSIASPPRRRRRRQRASNTPRSRPARATPAR